MQIIHITRESQIPLIGALPFGIIDRGSNLLQIRPTSCCNMNCTFCSTASNSELHPISYIVDCDYLIDWLKEVIQLKQCNEIEANIDSVGEPTSYPYLIELIEKIKEIKEVKFISMQTNGTLLTKELIKQLDQAGLNRINVSIHSLDEEQSKYLFGNKTYNLNNILEALKLIKNTSIELNLVPVWLPKLNDEEIIKLIRLAKELNCKIGIQKYEITKYSRKEKKAKATTWFKFFRHLKELEKAENYKLIQSSKDFNIKRIKKIPLIFQKGDIITAVIVCQGWLKNQMIASANNRAITILDCNKNIGDKIRIKILDAQDSIYIAKKT